MYIYDVLDLKTNSLFERKVFEILENNNQLKCIENFDYNLYMIGKTFNLTEN